MNEPTMRIKKNGAFSLVELATILAVIGILAAIALPAIGSIRKKAANSQDMANLRQIGAAALLYAYDNNGSFPTKDIPIPGTGAGGGRPSFHESIDRYLSQESKQNPASIYNYLRNDIWSSFYAKPYPGFSPSAGQKGPLAYAPNPYCYRTEYYRADWGGRINRIPNPSKIVLVAEVNWPAADDATGGSIHQATAPTTMDNVMSRYRVNRDGKGLYLFCDGRVDLLVGDQSEPALSAAGMPNIWRWW